MAKLSQLTIPVKNPSTGAVTSQTFELAGSGGGQDNTFRCESLSDWEALTQEEKNQYDSVDTWGDYTDVTDELEAVSNSVNQMGEQVGDVTELVATLSSQVATLQNQVAALTADTGWVSINSDLKYRKKGNVVTVIVTGRAASSWTTVGQLPDGVRPAWSLYHCNYTKIGGTTTESIYIDSNGYVKQYGNSTTTMLVTYLV